MVTHSQSHGEKVKMTIECTLDERIYIKMLAAKSRLTLSEFLLSYVRSDFPKEKKLKEKKPNKTTLDAIQESKEGKGIKCDSIEDFWKKMGMDPSA